MVYMVLHLGSCLITIKVQRREATKLKKAYDVANYFILLWKGTEDAVSNLKLNKLLYFAQGYAYEKLGRPLFSDKIEAWDLGPVVRDVYKKYQYCGKSAIDVVDDAFDVDMFDEEELSLLMCVAANYGKYTASTLVDMTHVSGSPWSIAYRPGGNCIIDPSDMKNYFSDKNHSPLFLEDMIDQNNVFTKLPKDEYDPDEDMMWKV